MKMDAGYLSLLKKEDMAVLMTFMKKTLKVCKEEDFHKLIYEFGQYFSVGATLNRPV